MILTKKRGQRFIFCPFLFVTLSLAALSFLSRLPTHNTSSYLYFDVGHHHAKHKISHPHNILKQALEYWFSKCKYCEMFTTIPILIDQVLSLVLFIFPKLLSYVSSIIFHYQNRQIRAPPFVLF